MFDFANSVFATTGLSMIIPVFLSSLAAYHAYDGSPMKACSSANFGLFQSETSCVPGTADACPDLSDKKCPASGYCKERDLKVICGWAPDSLEWGDILEEDRVIKGSTYNCDLGDCACYLDKNDDGEITWKANLVSGASTQVVNEFEELFGEPSAEQKYKSLRKI